jgi:hypothetical protein
MALIIDLEQEQEDFLMQLLSHFNFIRSIKKTRQVEDELLSDEEKNILDERWAKYEKEGVQGISWEDLKKQLKDEHGI